jgi:PAS domain S-box-containing protein
MNQAELLSAATLFDMINHLDVFVYATNPEDDTILFINESMRKHYKIEGDVIGKHCYKHFQEGMDKRCDFCPCHQLEKEPDRPVVWVEHSNVTGRSYRNTDRLIDWNNGKKIHFHHSVDITDGLKRDKIMQAVSRASALLLASNTKGDIEAPLVMGMELIGRSVNADRVHIWRNETIDGKLYHVYQYGWFNDENDPHKASFSNLRLQEDFLPLWSERSENFMRGEFVGGPISKLSAKEQVFFSQYDIKAVIVLPLFLDEKFWGFFSVDDCKEERGFDRDEINIFQSISMMMANAISQNALINKMNEAHERSMLMLDTSPICAQIWARDLSTIDCNEAGVKLYGFKNKQEYIERFITSCSPEFQPDGQRSDDKAVALVNKAFEEGICRFDWMHKMPDSNNDLIPADITLVRAKYKDQDVVIGYTTDMREQNVLLEKLNEESRKFEETAHWYRSILDAIPLAISVTDKDMNWTFGNKTLNAYTGLNVENMLGQPCSNINNTICNTNECVILRAKRGLKQSLFDYNGLSFQADVEILQNLEGEISGFIEVVQNITNVRELMNQRTEAEIASQAKSSFLASMSHEIRTPMNAILGVTEILIENNTITKDVKEGLVKIYNSGSLLLGIINDILDFSKIEAGKLDIIPEHYSVAELIGDSAHLNAMRIDSKPIEFKVLPDENIPARLIGDELRIKQILNNVLSNAFKYTEKGEVAFSVHSEPAEDGVLLVFSVRDTGIGMKEEQLQKLFEEYSRFEEGMVRGVEGTGLGLAITRRLIQLMNGEVYVESEYGKGSLFVVKLPQKVVNTETLGPEMAESLRQFRLVQQERKQKGQILREPMPYGSVLIVDDIEPNLYVAEGLMKPYGLKIETVMNGYDAIAKIKEGNVYDIIFMDHMMPGIDGIETTVKIREMEYREPIVALTANALAGQADIFLQSGFNEFISKPIDTRQLNHVLNKHVRDKQPPEVLEAARQKMSAEPEPAAESRSPFIDALCEINGLDVFNALEALGGMHEVYENTVRLSARLMPATIQKMDDYLAAGDLKHFAIEVHGLKGVTRSIGAPEIATIAGRLEISALNNGMDYCVETYPPFRETVVAFMDKLNIALAHGQEAEKDPVEITVVLEKVEKAKKIAEGYDAMGALEHIKPLARFSFGEEAEALLEKAIFDLEEFNCIGAVEKMGEVLTILN